MSVDSSLNLEYIILYEASLWTVPWTRNILYKASRDEIELHLVILYSAQLIWGRAYK